MTASNASKDKSNVKFEKFVEDVPIPGTKEIYESKNVIEKICWILFVIAGAGLTALFIFRVFQEYRENKTATKISYERNAVYEMPPMYVCPPVWYNETKIENTQLSRNAILFAISYLTSDKPTTNLTKLQITEIRKEFRNYMRKNNMNSIYEFYDHISLDSDSFIKNCYGCVAKEKLPTTRFCDTVCYKVTGKPIDVRLQTAQSPVVIELFPQNKSDWIPERRKFYALIIDSDDKFPIPLKEMLLQDNMVTNVYVTPKINKFLNSDENSCDDKKESEKYSKKLCHSDCIQRKFLFPYAGCYSMGFFDGPMSDLDANYPLCNGFTDTEGPEFMDIVEKGAVECYDDCVMSCRQKTYELSLMMTKQIVGSNRLVEDNETVINVFYEVGSFGIQTFEEVSTYSFPSMVSNVGGQLGLWVGASIMTVVQLFMFCMRICFSEAACRFWRRDNVAPDKQILKF